jgi:hypothetical protein
MVVPAYGDDLACSVNALTTAPATARYEITQSSIVVRNTFRLDKYTGRIHQMVKDKDGTLLWEEMIVHDRPLISAPTVVRFQLFNSGIAVRHTYLLDTATGATWQLMVATPETKPDGTPTPDTEKVSEWFPLQIFNIKK